MDVQEITALTLRNYNDRAQDFWVGTRDHDVSQNIAVLLEAIPFAPPFTILDFGCGPGRDLKTFAEKGHIAVGLEGAPRLAQMARDHSGCEVWEQDFIKLDLPQEYFHGVFANAAKCAPALSMHDGTSQSPSCLRSRRKYAASGFACTALGRPAVERPCARPQWLYGAMWLLLRPSPRAYLVLRAFASLSVARSACFMCRHRNCRVC